MSFLESLIIDWKESSSGSLSIFEAKDPLSLLPFLSHIQSASRAFPPQVVVLKDEETLSEFIKNISFFSSDLIFHSLSEFDVDFYSDLDPSSQNRAERIRWLYQARHAKKGEIFLMSLKGLLQKTLPPKDFLKQNHSFGLKEEISSNFTLLLEELGYKEVPLVEDFGSYSQRGGILDLYSPAHLHPIRLERAQDEIRSLRAFDPRTQRSLSSLTKFVLLPTRELLLSSQTKKITSDWLKSILLKHSKPQRDPKKKNVIQKTSPLLSKLSPFSDKIKEAYKALRSSRYFQGIDFCLPFFYKKLVSPLSYFPSSFFLWMTEFNELLEVSAHFHEECNQTFDPDLLRPPPSSFFETLPSLTTPSLCRTIFVLGQQEPLSWPEPEELKKKNSWEKKEKKDNETISDITLLSPSPFSPSASMEFKNSKKSNLEFTPKRNSTIAYPTEKLSSPIKAFQNATDIQELSLLLKEKLEAWQYQNFRIFIAFSSLTKGKSLSLILERTGFKTVILEKIRDFSSFLEEDTLRTPTSPQEKEFKKIHLFPKPLSQSLLFKKEKWVFLREKDLLTPTLFSSFSPSFSTPPPLHFKKKTSSPIQLREEKKNSSHKPYALLEDLEEEDLVVHKLHGIGQYERMKSMMVGGLTSEFLQIQYKGGDKLYLPIHRISLIHRFASSLHSTRILDKLGSDLWKKSKSKVKKQLREQASDLLKLYAKRLQTRRTPFSKKDEDFLRFEREFPYKETKDQTKAIEDVLKDMTEKETLMDRLICGDVGFGKTEVAMRGAFKAVQDGRQVAVIVPTTILSFQHQESFRQRFKNWPIIIEALNRFASQRDIKNHLMHLKQGKIDIVIGTHRLLSHDVEFKNLGLLIIDEEQKFGVSQKEKIHHLKKHVDCLMMSATPIPRTLNFSLSGLKDLSLILTPPKGRLSIRTFICHFDKNMIKKAFLREQKREGQILFIHNDIQSLPHFVADLKQLVPQIRIAMAHGRMKEGELEKTILSFFQRSLDVLVCTTIIESGMDIPKANTLFINEAQNFGLSQLYQLRGRVGRNQERAYCYLLLPSNEKKLTSHAKERLRTLREFSDLGSGVHIANKDLELRGGGNILGSAQSGHINVVGHYLYRELLEEAIQAEKAQAKNRKEKMKALSGKNVSTQSNSPLSERQERNKNNQEEKEESEDLEPDLHIPIEALIPESYVSNIRLRLAYYRALSYIETQEDISVIEEELFDRFGPLPPPVFNLTNLMWIRKECRDLKIKALSLRQRKILLVFLKSTPLTPEQVIFLSSNQKDKYALRPHNKLAIDLQEKGEENSQTQPKKNKDVTENNRNEKMVKAVSKEQKESDKRKQEMDLLMAIQKELSFLKTFC